ncbi:MAG: type IX secretion system outer membrane channel protein PorV [Bacteroidales bacterium]|jgi:hypothetical protein
MKIVKKLLLGISLLLFANSVLLAQNDEPTYEGQQARLGINTINSAVPFLTLSPDARSGSMGDLGVATTPDINSMHWNPAKYAFMDGVAGFSLNYTPWMRKIVSDINLINAVGYYKINDVSAVAASINYFSLGEVIFRKDADDPGNIVRPNEFSIDGTYARKFSEKISAAVATRFIYSNLTQGHVEGSKAGMAVAADISMYYTEPISIGRMDADIAVGVNISNIGSKLSYDVNKNQKEFIPTTFRVGPALNMHLDDYNSLLISAELSKLLVPTSPIRDAEGNVLYGKDDDISSILGLFRSFYDAPGFTINEETGDTIKIGKFREELQELMLSVGGEYWYNETFAVRAGYFFENPRKGDRQFITLGAGLKYNLFGIDLSYLISLGQRNPLQNTLRFSLSFNFDYDNRRR